MTPFLLKGTLLNEIWGGEYIKNLLGIDEPDTVVSQLLSLCGSRKAESVISSGEFAGLGITEALSANPKKLMGEGEKGNALPFSVRIIDSAERTPIEVSDADRLWFVLDCKQNAELLLGLVKETTSATVSSCLSKGTFTDLCSLVKVKKGDAYLIPSGVPFAAGRGVVIAEIAAAGKSYTLTDYGRVDADGARRTLNTEAQKLIKPKAPTLAEDDTMLFPFGTVKTLGSSLEFTAELLELDGNGGLYDRDNFCVLLVTDGRAIISYPSGNLSIKAGDCVWLPPDTRIILTGKTQLINIHR